ncbi:hypothetical protein ACKWRH_05290 [Bradyrhizobium sp. Pa8]|uniref:hypothetical protein n=1 Tax=Bradyrhizobium sp. Pa8 TaxID=3386552 RepID=UPI00403FAEB3
MNATRYTLFIFIMILRIRYERSALMTKPDHPFRIARVERLVALLEGDYRMAIDPNTSESTTKSDAPDPDVLDCRLCYPILIQEGASRRLRCVSCEPYGMEVSTKSVGTP